MNKIPNLANKTIFECCIESKDINKSLQVIHYADTEVEAIQFLETNGGGIYRNAIHKFKVRVLFV